MVRREWNRVRDGCGNLNIWWCAAVRCEMRMRNAAVAAETAAVCTGRLAAAAFFCTALLFYFIIIHAITNTNNGRTRTIQCTFDMYDLHIGLP